jgi:hypothetical protein
MAIKVSLNWGAWLYGLIAGFISGGAGSVTAGVAAIGIDPNSFNLTSATAQ